MRRVVALARAAAKRTDFVVRVVVVGRDEDLVTRNEWQPVIHERQPRRRVRRERDLVWLPAHVSRRRGGDRVDHPRRILGEHALLDREQRVRVERRAHGLDRLAHRRGCETRKKLVKCSMSGANANIARTSDQRERSGSGGVRFCTSASNRLGNAAAAVARPAVVRNWRREISMPVTLRVSRTKPNPM
jgi:hypothetical protein